MQADALGVATQDLLVPLPLLIKKTIAWHESTIAMIEKSTIQALEAELVGLYLGMGRTWKHAADLSAAATCFRRGVASDERSGGRVPILSRTVRQYLALALFELGQLDEVRKWMLEAESIPD